MRAGRHTVCGMPTEDHGINAEKKERDWERPWSRCCLSIRRGRIELGHFLSFVLNHVSSNGNAPLAVGWDSDLFECGDVEGRSR